MAGIGSDGMSSFQMDVIREIGNIGAGNAATALAKMLDKKIDMSVPIARVMKFSEVTDVLGGAETKVVGILLGVHGDIKGSILFILSLSSAQLLVNILMGRSIDSPLEFEEMSCSALKEIGNILAASYLSALSTLTKLKIMPNVPGLAVDMAGAILSVPIVEHSQNADSVLYIENEFTYGSERVIGDFFLVPDKDSYRKLLEALGVV